MKKTIAIIGGGPSALFIYKRIIESGQKDLIIDIFEATEHLGSGMPYSTDGSNVEHVTNVSGNEIPNLAMSVTAWLATLPDEMLKKYNLDRDRFTEYKVLPRLLFGDYLYAQFNLLQHVAKTLGLITNICFKSKVIDIMDHRDVDKVIIELEGGKKIEFDYTIICTGHTWPTKNEGHVDGYFDSPYPPSKLIVHLNHAIAIRGSSLTAIDAIRTLARQHGTFIEDEPHKLSFHVYENSKDFKMVMHSRNGLLPGIRFHLDDPHLSKKSLLSKKDILAHRKENDGFVSLDFIFEKDFKNSFIDKEPAFYNRIKDLNLEQFVELMIGLRERGDPFLFFKVEYDEAQKSIHRQESIYWKEMLAVLSFAMNYPAKYMSAEDMVRLQQVLMPLIAIVIAFVPQRSCEEMIALHEAGRLELIAVGNDSHVTICPEGGVLYHHTNEAGQTYQKYYKTFIDCIGQRHLTLDMFPFKSLVNKGTVSPARLKFRSPENATTMKGIDNADIEHGPNDSLYLNVPGIAITDNFNVLERTGLHNPRIYMMAVPYMAGHNPDYSGLDFCEEASKTIVDDMFKREMQSL